MPKLDTICSFYSVQIFLYVSTIYINVKLVYINTELNLCTPQIKQYKTNENRINVLTYFFIIKKLLQLLLRGGIVALLNWTGICYWNLIYSWMMYFSILVRDEIEFNDKFCMAACMMDRNNIMSPFSSFDIKILLSARTQLYIYSVFTNRLNYSL